MKTQNNKTKITLEEAKKTKGKNNMAKLLAEQNKEKTKRK